MAVAKRPKSRPTRSLLPLDIHGAYVAPPGSSDGWVRCLFNPISVGEPDDGDFEMKFWEAVVVRNPQHVEALMALGDTYTRVGQYTKGLEIDLRLVQLRPKSGVVRYNLACSYALTGRPDDAFRELEASVEFGYRDPDHMQRDTDLDSLKNDPRWANILRRMQKPAS